MMSKKNRVGLAAIGLLIMAVVEVAGQMYSPSPVGTVTGPLESSISNKAGSFGVAYTVAAPTATLTYTSKTLKDVSSYNPGVSTTVANANAGTIKVVTNAPSWDITFYAKNKGQLLKGGVATGTPLKIRDASNITATQDAIVKYELGMYAGSTTSDTKLVTVVDSATIRAADVTSQIAFSQVFGENAGIYSSTDLTAVDVVLGSRPVGTIKTIGFAAPPTTGVTFIVNGGLGLPSGYVVGGNEAGTYTDTLKLNFIATGF
jgi:hypothetical protein